jgi:hypothetical protein
MDFKIDNVKIFNGIFLSNISKISDSCIIKSDKNNLTCVASNTDGTVISYTHLNQKNNFTENEKVLNIPDVKKLNKIFTCIDDNIVNLKLDTNNISYNNSNFKFKYHLLEDGIISTPKVNVDKISKLDFNTVFAINKQALSNIIKASSIALDVTKLYLFTEDSSVFCDFTDNNRHNVDSIALKICDDYQGEAISSPVPINFEIIRIISSQKFNTLNIKFNSKLGVFLFDLEDQECSSKYIVSALIN